MRKITKSGNKAEYAYSSLLVDPEQTGFLFLLQQAVQGLHHLVGGNRTTQAPTHGQMVWINITVGNRAIGMQNDNTVKCVAVTFFKTMQFVMNMYPILAVRTLTGFIFSQ